jgi:hypothetical protein
MKVRRLIAKTRGEHIEREHAFNKLRKIAIEYTKIVKSEAEKATE